MKIIFSRKGFDSSSGGFPSLIFPDGTLFSIPIPSKDNEYKYKDLEYKYENESIQSILNDLTNKQINSGKKRECDYTDEKFHCHYDPMPISNQDFQGIAFGQQNNTEGHLRNQNIAEDDIFVFYGWFKNIEKIKNKWVYVEKSKDIHLIWSYLKVGRINHLDNIYEKEKVVKDYPFLSVHPHIEASNKYTKNTIYLSKEFNFFKYSEKRCLTDLKTYKCRSTWRLPIYFNYPDAFTFLKNFRSYDESDVIINYQGFGQEFVLDLEKVKSKNAKNAILKYIKIILK